MADIFISYTQEDIDLVRRLAEALQSKGWTVFWDRTIPPGQEWRQYLGNELNEARCVVVGWSEASRNSTWVGEEADIGRRRGILVPVFFEEVPPPLGLGNIQGADLTGWDGSDTVRGFSDLMEGIRLKLEETPIPKSEEVARQREKELVETAEGVKEPAMFGESESLVQSVVALKAFPKPERQIERVFVHCSASDNAAHDDVEVMRRWHTDPRPQGRGWSDVGYHFFIRKNGELQEGRSLERTPAAQRGHNTGTIAICLHGLKEDLFTSEQFATLIDLCEEINEAYDEQVTYHGHREVSNKECPVFDYQRVLGLDTDGAMTRPTDLDPTQPLVTPPRPVLRRTARGDAVTVLQGLLNKKGADIVEDGIFGRGTFEAVVRFQLQANLVADGIVGPATWNALTATD